MKKRTIVLIIIGSVLVLGIIIGIIVINNNNTNQESDLNNNVMNNKEDDISDNNINEEYFDDVLEEEYTTNYRVLHNEKNNEILFYKYNKEEKKYIKVNKYVCLEESCSEYSGTQGLDFMDLELGLIHLRDGGNLVFFDIESGVLGKFKNIGVDLYPKSDWSIPLYVLIKGIDTEKYGVVDLRGNIIKEFKLDLSGRGVLSKYSLRTPKGVYSIEENMMAYVENNKWGIMRITTDETLIETKYEDISIINNEYFRAQENGKWYLYSFETKNKKIDEGYDYLCDATDSILLVQQGGYIYIKDYNGINLTEEKIKYNDYLPDRLVTVNDNIITIDLEEKYEFDIINNTLKKIA